MIILSFSLKTKKSTSNVDESNFLEKKKKGKQLHVVLSFLYPAGYANSMWIMETLKLQTILIILIPKKQCCDAWIIYF